MEKLDEGEVLIKTLRIGKTSKTIITAKIELRVSYTYTYETTHDGKTKHEFDYFDIFTNDVGGGNHFVIATPSLLDAELNNNKAGFPICELDELKDLIDDFEERYNAAKKLIKKDKV